MPARRLPWFKLWPEAMRHEKIALLSDGAFRTWIMALADGSEQPTRWRFASVRHAATVTGRPVKQIRELISARLLDESPNGEIWVHDWRHWQDRYDSDFTPRTVREDSANGLPPLSPLEPPVSPRRGETETGEAERETDTTPQPPPQAEGESPPNPPRGAATSRRRRDERAEEAVTPLTTADRDRWEAAIGHLQRFMMPSLLSGVIKPLEPAGRAQGGGLLLRAPPNIAGDARAKLSVVRRALEEVGDAAGSRATIVD